MPFLKSLSIEPGEKRPFPFQIPSFKFLKGLEFVPEVTLIMGQNGCGKSSLCEALAMVMHLPLIDGKMDWDDSFAAAKAIQPYLRVNFQRKPTTGFFFRAEDFSQYLQAVQMEKSRIYADLGDLSKKYKDRIINEVNESHNYPLASMRKRFGDNLNHLSHGEACLSILDAGMRNGGVIILDEPEIGLHPVYLSKLIDTIISKAEDSNYQFVIATHSPMIASIPGAKLYEIQSDGIKSGSYRETEHYKIYKAYLDAIESPP